MRVVEALIAMDVGGVPRNRTEIGADGMEREGRPPPHPVRSANVPIARRRRRFLRNVIFAP
jgi:hypothetical protein